jgi:hypothetical protein
MIPASQGCPAVRLWRAKAAPYSAIDASRGPGVTGSGCGDPLHALVARRWSPAVGSAVSPGLIGFAGAVVSATGLSLRSPRAVKIFFRDAGLRVPASPALSFLFAR